MSWIPARAALALLGVQPQTLYANVSRGRIRAKPDPSDPRRSLYHRADIDRMAVRRTGRRSAAAVAQQAMEWGDPVLASGISTVEHGRLWYRGCDAVELSDTWTLEQTAGLLWGAEDIVFGPGRRRAQARNASLLSNALSVLATRVDVDPPSRGRARQVLVPEAMRLLEDVMAAMLGPAPEPGAPAHRRMALCWKRPRAQDFLRRALVLLADHELNASTFATRVAVSTGTSLAAGLMAGLATLAGPLHGGSTLSVKELHAAAQRDGAAASVREYSARGYALPAFGHPLYPNGDSRAAALLTRFKIGKVYAAVCQEGVALTGERPNIDFALASICEAFKLPPEAPFVIFALARSVGWMAHAFEQIETGHLIRPRARYTGVALP
ncbi:MAG: citrate synthase [Bordetella sp.]|uniref:citrate synthase n=1 Tax=Bordetella sp. TaxID=28081 RepID=UPI003F7C72C3